MAPKWVHASSRTDKPYMPTASYLVAITLYKLDSILNGSLHEFLDQIKLEDQKIQLAELDQ